VVSCPRFEPAKLVRRPNICVRDGVRNNTWEGALSLPIVDTQGRLPQPETTVRIDGRTHWNWVFQNDQVVSHVIRNSRAASVVADVLAGHRPSIWVSDLYSAQQGLADLGRPARRINCVVASMRSKRETRSSRRA
jgi:hypothetical protein